ncbi:MAG: cytochrome c3 family protein [Deferribacterota bacterium]|nr:cytochrome c3 family protein [Deferribacterota bacterium]
MKKLAVFVVLCTFVYVAALFAQPATINLKEKYAPNGSMPAVIFDHQGHVSKGLQCMECHTQSIPQLKDQTTGEALDTSGNPMAVFHNQFCFACHQETGGPTQTCNACHK